jgi:putative flippase GtrA
LRNSANKCWEWLRDLLRAHSKFGIYVMANGSLTCIGWLALHLEVSGWGFPAQAAPYANTVPLAFVGYVVNKHLPFRERQVKAGKSQRRWYAYKFVEFVANHGFYALFVGFSLMSYMHASVAATLLVAAPSYWVSSVWIFNTQDEPQLAITTAPVPQP